MKTLVAIAMFSALTAGHLSAQSLEATVPFDFTANGVTLPPGNYQVKVVGAAMVVITDGKHTLIGRPMPSTEGRVTAAKLVFRRYGDRYFLAAAEIPSTQWRGRWAPDRVEQEMMATVRPELTVLVAGR